MADILTGLAVTATATQESGNSNLFTVLQVKTLHVQRCTYWKQHEWKTKSHGAILWCILVITGERCCESRNK